MQYPLAFECLNASRTPSNTFSCLYNLQLSVIVTTDIKNHYRMTNLLLFSLFINIFKLAVEHK